MNSSNGTTKPFSMERAIQKLFRKEKKTRKIAPLEFVTLGGVYCDFGESVAVDKPSSYKSLDTVKTEGSSSLSPSSSSSSWQSSGSIDHHQGAPWIAKNFSMRKINPDNKYLSESEKVARVVVASGSLPKSNTYLSSNHLLINDERLKRAMAPLKRSAYLDEIARSQAKAMADADELFHSSPDDLCDVITAHSDSSSRVGQNVARGASVAAIHRNMIRESLADRNNILDRRFLAMGIGTAKSANNTLYICQIFHD